MERKKPKFIRKDWNKKSKLNHKKKRKWRRPTGRHGKVRLGEKGYMRRPKIGWGTKKTQKKSFLRVENLNQLKGIEKFSEIIIAKVGRKLRHQLIEEAEKRNIKILNKYKKSVIKNEPE